MKFAKIVFRVAAIWGVLIIAPLYFMFDLIGRKDPPLSRIRHFFMDSRVWHWRGKSPFSLSPAIPCAIARS